MFKFKIRKKKHRHIYRRQTIQSSFAINKNKQRNDFSINTRLARVEQQQVVVVCCCCCLQECARFTFCHRATSIYQPPLPSPQPVSAPLGAQPNTRSQFSTQQTNIASTTHRHKGSPWHNGRFFEIIQLKKNKL